MDAFWRNAAATSAAMVSLLLIGGSSFGAQGWAARVLELIRLRDLNPEDLDRQTQGYYEDLLDRGAETTGAGMMIPGDFDLIGGKRALGSATRQLKFNMQAGFLRWEYRPNLNLPEFNSVHFTSNSFGMADREYTRAKPKGTRRIALVGDSVARGWSIPEDQDFETLLENRLNEEYAEGKRRSGKPDRYEILNFAVDSYTLPQILATAQMKASGFEPDVYMLALTELSITTKWDRHIIQVVRSGADLKYDFLREMIRQAGVAAADSELSMSAKLAPFRIRFLRWVLSALRDHAQNSGTSLIVVLVPTALPARIIEERYGGISALLSDLGITTISLLDAFEDHERVRLGTRDHHPNLEGHHLLYESLHRKLRGDPDAWRKLAGSGLAVTFVVDAPAE